MVRRVDNEMNSKINDAKRKSSRQLFFANNIIFIDNKIKDYKLKGDQMYTNDKIRVPNWKSQGVVFI